MKLTIEQKTLRGLLAHTQGTAKKKSTMPILECLRLEASDGSLCVRATDLVYQVRARADAEVSVPGAVLVDAKVLGDIVKSLPAGPVSLDAMDRGLVVKAGKARFSLPGQEADDYPLHHPAAGEAVEIDADMLVTLIERVAFSMSTDEARPHLAGVLLEIGGGRARAVTTDGHRLTIAEVAYDGPSMRAMLVPCHAIAKLKRVLESDDGDGRAATLRCDDDRIAVSRDGVEASVLLSHEGFPPYAKVVPAPSEHVVVVNRVQLLDAIRRVGLITAPGKVGSVRFSIGNRSITIDAESPELGNASEELVADNSGPAAIFGLNGRYMIELLSTIETDEVLFEIGDSLAPVVVKPYGDDGRSPTKVGVVMPVRL